MIAFDVYMECLAEDVDLTNLSGEELEEDENGNIWITTKSGKKIKLNKDGEALTTLGGNIKKGTKFDKVKQLK